MPPKTFLLDLDETLLGNDMNDFLPPYFKGIQKRLAPFLTDVRATLMASVQAVQANQEPTLTNMTVFMTEFARHTEHPPAAIQAVIDAFYQEDYPHLQAYTTFKPEARQIVSHLLSNGHRVVIATNPLFPATAIKQRLAWAGVNDFPYSRVTFMENSHFCKPNPAYYQEILAKINSRPENSWMVGDSLENDIIPARSLGLKSWWITNSPPPPTIPSPISDRHGLLPDLLAWLKSGDIGLTV